MGDEFTTIVKAGTTASKEKRAKLRGVVRGLLSGNVIGYRCSGCDRRLDLDS